MQKKIQKNFHLTEKKRKIYIVFTLATSIIFTATTIIHAGTSAANIILGVIFVVEYAKYANSSVSKFKKILYGILIGLCNIFSLLVFILVAFGIFSAIGTEKIIELINTL